MVVHSFPQRGGRDVCADTADRFGRVASPSWFLSRCPVVVTLFSAKLEEYGPLGGTSQFVSLLDQKLESPSPSPSLVGTSLACCLHGDCSCQAEP